MSGVAKKYVKALIASCNSKVLGQVDGNLEKISSAFSSVKFKNIILSPDVKKDDKVNLILSFDTCGKETQNLVKILSKNEKLESIPAITKELKYQIAHQEKNFEGVVITDFEVGIAKISELETALGKKFEATVSLKNRVTDYPGIKVELADLGVEVSFSTTRLKAQIAEHILKAI